MVNDRRLAFSGEKTGAAVHPVTGKRRLQLCRVPGPVQHVRAGDMDIREGSLALPLVPQDVVQVKGAIEMECCVRIARQTLTTRMHEVEIQCERVIDVIRGDDSGRGGEQTSDKCKFSTCFQVQNSPCCKRQGLPLREFAERSDPGVFPAPVHPFDAAPALGSMDVSFQ